MNSFRSKFILICAAFLAILLGSPVNSDANNIESLKQAVRENTKTPAELEKLCETGDAESCVVLAALYYQGKGVEKNRTRSEELFQTGCDKGNLDACYILANFYLDAGKGFGKNIGAAIKLFENSCDQFHALSCLSAGQAYLGWFSPNHKSDVEKAEKYLERACELGEGFGCIFQSEIYGKGHHRERDMKRSRGYYDKACKVFKKNNAYVYSNFCNTVCTPNRSYPGSWASSTFCEIM